MKKKKLYKKALYLLANYAIASCDECPIYLAARKECEPNQIENCNQRIVRYWIRRAKKEMA